MYIYIYFPVKCFSKKNSTLSFSFQVGTEMAQKMADYFLVNDPMGICQVASKIVQNIKKKPY